MKLNEIVGNNIKNIRTSLDIKAEYLANEIGVSKSTLSLIENGKIEISIERLAIIASKLNVPVTSFLPQSTSNLQISRDQSTQNVVNGVQKIQSMDENTFKVLQDVTLLLNNLLNQK